MTTPWIQDGSGEWQQMGGPRIVEPQDPGEMAEAQLHAQLGQVSLSPTEQAYLRQLQYGRQSIQRQVDAGQIRPQTAMAMLGQIDERAIPLRVRASQLPIIQRRMQILQLQRNMAQRETMMQQNAQFRARTLQDRITTVNGVSFMETAPGQFEPLPVGLQEGRGPTVRPEMNPTQLLEIANRFRREYRDQNGSEPSQEAVQAHVNRQMDLLGGLIGHPPSTAPTARGAAPAAPGRPAAPAGTGPSPAATQSDAPPGQDLPSVSVLRQLRDGIRQEQSVSDRASQSIGAPARVTDPSRRENQSLMHDLDEAIDILDAYRGAPIPRDRRERLQAIRSRVAPRLQGAPTAGPAIPPPPRRVSSTDPTYNREESNRAIWEARDQSAPADPREYDIPPSIYD